MEKHTKPVIILTGGGSGGHITPILSLAHELRRQAPASRLVYIGLRGEKIIGLGKQFQVFNDQFHISAGKYRRFHGDSTLTQFFDFRTLLQNIRDIFKVLAGIVQSRRLIKKIRPDIVFSKGSFVAVPVGVAAKLAKVPIITHDSDAIAGLANRLIGRWAVVHATGMDPGDYNYPKASIHYTGIPISSDIKPVTAELQAKSKAGLGLKAGDQVLMIGGAGLGSKTLNDLTSAIAPKLLTEYQTLHIFHFTGDQHADDVGLAYNKLLPANQLKRVKTFGFTPDFKNFSAAADLIVTRAGATSLAEFALQGKACIVIPSPWLAGGHQTANAQFLNSAKAAIILPNGVKPETLHDTVRDLLDNAEKRQKLIKNISQLSKPQAASDLARLIIETATVKL